MSISKSTPKTSESYDCVSCGDEFDARRAVAGSFCSHACHDAHRGEKRVREIFRELEHDHRFCSTCGRTVKTIEKPPERNSKDKAITDAAVGWQHRTQHGSLGQQSVVVLDDDDDEPDVPDLDFEDGHEPVYVFEYDGDTYNTGTYGDFRNPVEPSIRADEPVKMGTICRCGQTDHKDENETLRDRFPFATAYYLAVAASKLRSEDKHDVEIDRERLFEAVLEQILPVQEQRTVDIRKALAAAVVLDD